MSVEEFSAVIERLYATAIDPTSWEGALRGIEDFTGAAGMVVDFLATAPNAGESFVLSGRFTAEQCAIYARDYIAICPRIAFGQRRRDLLFQYDALIGDDAELDRDPTYDWFERVNGVRYYLGAGLSPIAGYKVGTSLQRTRAQGHPQRRDIETLGLIRPHLDNALRLSNLVGTLTAERQAALLALDRIAHGIVALDAAGHILFANPAAEAILAADDGLTAVANRLVATRAADNRALERLVSGNRPGERRSGWLRLPRPSGLSDYRLFSAPLTIDTGLLPGPERPYRLVAVVDPEKRASLDPAMLRALFGLTPKEAEIATLLVRGFDMTAIAQRLAITPETSRTHLKNIFRKLEVSRQQDLIERLLVLAPLGDGRSDGGS